jgi:hypothetical protein
MRPSDQRVVDLLLCVLTVLIVALLSRACGQDSTRAASLGRTHGTHLLRGERQDLLSDARGGVPARAKDWQAHARVSVRGVSPVSPDVGALT